MADFCHPMDCSLPGSSVHGVFQERILEGLPFPPPEDLPNPGMEPVAPALADRFFPTPTPGKLYFNQANCSKSSGLELSCFKKSQLYNNWKILQETIVLSCVQLCVYKYCIAHQALLSMGFFRQEYQSGLSFPSLGDLPDSGVEPMSSASSASPAWAGGFFTTELLGSPLKRL